MKDRKGESEHDIKKESGMTKKDKRREKKIDRVGKKGKRESEQQEEI